MNQVNLPEIWNNITAAEIEEARTNSNEIATKEYSHLNMIAFDQA